MQNSTIRLKFAVRGGHKSVRVFLNSYSQEKGRVFDDFLGNFSIILKKDKNKIKS